MKRYLKMLGGAVVTIVVIALIAVIIFSRTERCARILRAQVLSALGSAIRGETKLDTIALELPRGAVEIRNLAISYNGQPVITAPRATAVISWSALLRLSLGIGRVEAPGLHVWARQGRDGNWDLVEAFAPRTPPPPQAGGSALALAIANILVDNAAIDATLSDGTAIQISKLALDASFGLEPSGIRFDAERLDFALATARAPSVEVNAAGLAYQNQSEPASVELDKIQLASEHSRAILSGRIENLKTLETHVEGQLAPIAGGDLARFVPQWPAREAVNGTVNVEGPLAALRAKLAIAAGDAAQLAATAQANLDAKPPTYDAHAELLQADLARLAPTAGVAGGANLTIDAKGVGFALGGIAATVRLAIDNAIAQKIRLGRLTLDAALANSNATFTANLAQGIQRAKAQGKISIAAIPEYQVALAVEHFNPGPVMSNARQAPPARNAKLAQSAKQAVPGGDINLDASVSGRGFQPATMDGRAGVNLKRSTIGQVTIDGAQIDAGLARNHVTLTRATARAAGARVDASGTVALGVRPDGRLSYALEVPQLGPVLALVGQKGSGRVKLNGTATGNLRRIEARGAAEVDSIAMGSQSLKHGNIRFDLFALDQKLPYGNVEADLVQMNAGLAMRTMRIQVQAPRGVPPRANVKMTSVDMYNHRDALAADVTYQPPRLGVHLTQLDAGSSIGTWRLRQPSDIALANGGLAVTRFVMQNGNSDLYFEGRASPTGPQNLTMGVERFDLAAFSGLVLGQHTIGGVVSAQATSHGTAAAPQLNLNLEATRIVFDAQHIAGLKARANYAPRAIQIDARLDQDQSHALTLNGSIPAVIGWSAGEFQHQFPPGMDLRVRTNGIDLATFQPLAGKNAQNLGGRANADVEITGSIEAPRFNGIAKLRDATAKVPATNVTVTGGRADIRFTNQSITIDEISARADNGKLNAHGTIGMNQFKPGPLDLTLTMDNWPAIATYRYKAMLGAQLRLTGLATAPVLTGQLDVLNATIRPELDFLGQQPIPKDETIVVVENSDAPLPNEAAPPNGSNAGQSSAGAPQPKPASPSLFDAAAMDVTVVIHRNTWIKHQGLAEVELNGRFRVRKRPNRELILVGTVEAGTGWLAFEGRRFNLMSGRIDFTGGTPIDPSLHVVAEYKPQGYTVDITVAGTASQPTLALSSTPTLPQADILSLVLFGKTTANLTKSDQASMQQQAATLATSVAARGIGQQVMTAMGLEDLGFSIEQVGSGTAVGYGKNLTENLRATASQTVSGQKGQQAGLEYNVTPEIKITTSTSPRNNNQVGAEWHKRY